MLDTADPAAVADAIAAGHEDLTAAAYRTLALAYYELVAERDRRDTLQDAADRARRMADEAGAVGGWIHAVSGAV